MQNHTVKLFKYINLATIWILIFSVFTFANLPILKAPAQQISGVAFLTLRAIVTVLKARVRPSL